MAALAIIRLLRPNCAALDVARLGPCHIAGDLTAARRVADMDGVLQAQRPCKFDDIGGVGGSEEADPASVLLGIATLRFTTVNPRGQSSFNGKVVALSPASIAGENGQRYFRAQIMVDDPAALARNRIDLQPGLPVTVNVNTQSRTLFDYLFAPVADAMSGAFREE